MPNELADLLNEVLASPLGSVIASVGEGVAEAQQALDEASLAKTLEIYRESDDDLLRVLREIGYRPTFYVLPETVGEVNVSMRLSGGGARQPAQPRSPAFPLAAGIRPDLLGRLDSIRKVQPVRAYITPVDASFQNRYNYEATASAKLTFKIVPVPPPPGVEELRVVPELMSSTVQSARSVLELLDLPARFVDRGGNVLADPAAAAVVERHEPAAGAILGPGRELTLHLNLDPA